MTAAGDKSRRRPAPLVPETISAVLPTPAEEVHRAALVVAHHATGPDDARELLDMLELLDLHRPGQETTAASAPTGPARPVVGTEAAAEALRTTATSLRRYTHARIVTPRRDPDG